MITGFGLNEFLEILLLDAGNPGNSSAFDLAGLGLSLEDGSGVVFLGLDCSGVGSTGLAPK